MRAFISPDSIPRLPACINAKRARPPSASSEDGPSACSSIDEHRDESCRDGPAGSSLACQVGGRDGEQEAPSLLLLGRLPPRRGYGPRGTRLQTQPWRIPCVRSANVPPTRLVVRVPRVAGSARETPLRNARHGTGTTASDVVPSNALNCRDACAGADSFDCMGDNRQRIVRRLWETIRALDAENVRDYPAAAGLIEAGADPVDVVRRSAPART